MKPLRKILVGTDFSETSDRAVDYALRLVELSGGALVIAHAYEIPALAASAEQASTAADLLGDVVRAAETSLTRLREIAVSRGVQPEIVLRQGPAAGTIVAAARELGCDLVVVGTHGRRGLGRLLLGSVAEEIVRTSEAPVLTVRG